MKNEGIQQLRLHNVMAIKIWRIDKFGSIDIVIEYEGGRMVLSCHYSLGIVAPWRHIADINQLSGQRRVPPVDNMAVWQSLRLDGVTSIEIKQDGLIEGTQTPYRTAVIKVRCGFGVMWLSCTSPIGVQDLLAELIN